MEDFKKEIDQSLSDQFYDGGWDRNETTWSLITFPNTKDPNKQYWWADDEIDFKNKINEANEPESTDFPIKINSYEQGQVIGEWLKKHGYTVNITHPPFNVGKGKFIPFILNSNSNKVTSWKNIIDEIKINESRYTQFKNQTTKPQPKEVLHRAIKEIQLKLDEVNKLIDYTTRIKGELCEGDEDIEYLKRTKNSIYKIYNKLKETFEKMNLIDK